MIIKKGLKQNLAINTQVTRCEQNVSFPIYLQRKECFITVTYIRYISDPFYNYVHFVLLLMC
jgi:hypothetical protein